MSEDASHAGAPGPVGPPDSGGMRVGRDLDATATASGLVLERRVEGPGGPIDLRRQTPRSWRPRYADVLGRDREAALADDVARASEVLEFSGDPGVGKTALLRYVAFRADADGPPLVKLKPAPVDDVLPVLARRFWDAGGESWVATPELCEDLLGDVEGVLVLDQPPFSEDDLHTLLDAAPRCAVLLTSRRRLLRGKGPKSEPLRGLAPDVAVALFEERLGEALGDDHRAGARELCELLDGYPWHIEQAAGLVRDRRTSLEELFGAVATMRGDGGGRRWIADTVAASLDDAQWRAIDVLEHFQCPVHLRHFGVLAQLVDPSEVLESLEHLGVVESNSPVYALCEGRLPARPARRPYDREQDALEYLAGWAHERRHRADELLADAPLLVSAVRLGARAPRRAREAVRIALALEAALAPSGAWTTWGTVLTSGREAARRTGDTRAEAFCLHQLGARALCLGDRRRAVRYLRRAQALRERAGDAEGTEMTAVNLRLAGARPGRRWRRVPAKSRSARAPTALRFARIDVGAPGTVPAPEAAFPTPAVMRRWTVLRSATATTVLLVALVLPVAMIVRDGGDAVLPAGASLSATARVQGASADVAEVTVRNGSSGTLVLSSNAQPVTPGSDQPTIIENDCASGRRLAAGETCSVTVRVGDGRAAPDEVLVRTRGHAETPVPVTNVPREP